MARGYKILEEHKSQFELILQIFIVLASTIRDKIASRSIYGERKVNVDTNVPNAKEAARLKILLRDRKPTNMLFRSDRTFCFSEKTSQDYEKEKTMLF